MANFGLLIVALLLGMVFARRGWMPDNADKVLNAWILRVALPALVLVQIPRINFDPALIFAATGPWLVMLGALVFIIPIGYALGWTRARIGCVLLTAGLGNTSFMGIPLILALRGESGVGTSVIADQFGSFLALSTLGIVVAATCSGQRITFQTVAKRVLLFPPFIALCIALITALTPGWPDAIEQVLDRLAETLTPIALFSVGLALKFGDVPRYRTPITVALGWKLLLAPAVIFALAYAFSTPTEVAAVTVLQCAMAPMITAGILASDSGLEPKLSTAIVGSGIALSLITVPLWALLF